MQNPKQIGAELYFISEAGPRGLFCQYELDEALAVDAFQHPPPETERAPSPTGLPTAFGLGVELIRTNLAHRFRRKFLREEITPGFNPLVQVSRLEGFYLFLVLIFPDRTRSRAIDLPRPWAMTSRLKERLFRDRPADISRELFDHDNWTTFAAILETDFAPYLTDPITQAAISKRIAIDPAFLAIR